MVGGSSGTQERGPACARETATRTGTRGQSSVIGVALLFAIVVVGLSIVAAFGGMALTDTQDRMSTSRAEKVMTQFDSEAALVALGSTDSRQVSLSGPSDQYSLNEDAGWMKVTATNFTTGKTTVIMNKTLGELRYDNGEAIIAYQGGGVWRKGEGDATMVSPPEFHYRGATLTVPAVSITGDGAPNGKVTVTELGTNQTYPDRSRASPASTLSFDNPVEGSRVEVTVKSNYYRGWGTFFERRTDGAARYDDANETVTLTLVGDLEQNTIKSATASLSASGKFIVRGAPLASSQVCPGGAGGGSKVLTDSYNSSGTSDDYCTQFDNSNTGDQGDIVYGKDVDIDFGSGNGVVNGDISSGGDVTAGSKTTVEGFINWTDSCSGCEAATGDPDEVNQISGLTTVNSINNRVQTVVEKAKEDGDTLGSITTSTTIGTSNDLYYADKIDLGSGDTLKINTTGGDVTLGVRDTIILDGGEIKVDGNGTVRLYFEGRQEKNSCQCEFYMDEGKVSVPGDDAPQFWLYGQKNLTVNMDGSGSSDPSRFTGVIFSPPGDSGSAKVEIKRGFIKGGIVTGTTEIPNGGRGSFHYDKALRDEEILSGPGIIKITYLHISNNRIEVSG